MSDEFKALERLSQLERKGKNMFAIPLNQLSRDPPFC